MKKIFTIAAILLSVTTFAAERPKPAKISVTSSDRATIQVKIDGRKYDLNRNTFAMSNIKAGYHTIEIYRVENAGMWRTRRPQVVYSNSLYIAPSQIVDIDINRFGKVQVTKSGFDRFDRDDHGVGRGKDGRDNDWNDRDRDGHNGRY